MLWPGRGDSRREATVLEAADRSVKMRTEQYPLDPSVTLDLFGWIDRTRRQN